MEVTLRAVGGRGDDVNKGRNKARSVLEHHHCCPMEAGWWRGCTAGRGRAVSGNRKERLEGRSEGEKRRPLQHGECKDGEDKSSRQAGREGT